MKKLFISLMFLFAFTMSVFSFTTDSEKTAVNNNTLFESVYNVTITNNGCWFFLVRVSTSAPMYFTPVFNNLTAASVYTATLYEKTLFDSNALTNYPMGANVACVSLSYNRTNIYTTTFSAASNFGASNVGTALFTMYLTGTNTMLSPYQLMAGRFYLVVLSNTVATTTNIVATTLQFTR